ncbi:MAG TPA: mismatch-specific DNA-glycosylase [Rhodothermia bacterium]|nr:mismatch-specific DNA-glycosylase [Rhodothermia bacterium]
MLPDLLKRNLSLVICGTGAGRRSAEIGHYYAGRGNRFWQTLAEVQLTPRLLAPADYEHLLSSSIGLTDLVKDQAGRNTQIRFGRRDALQLRAKIMIYQPRYLCFNGKRAAEEFLRSGRVEFGVQSERIGRTVLFVAPSTSRAANGSWDLTVWCDLARRVLRRSAPDARG